MDDNNQKELVDRIAEKVSDTLGRNIPLKRIRRSQILTAFLGAVGFALFTDGIIKLFANFSSTFSLVTGIVLMVATGLLVQNLSR